MIYFFQMRVPPNFELIVLAHLLKSKSQKKQFLKIFESDESSWNITLTHYPWTPFICKKKDFAVNIPRTVFSRINQIWRPRPGRFRSTAALVLCFELTCNNIVFVFCILWLFSKIINGSVSTILEFGLVKVFVRFGCKLESDASESELWIGFRSWI